MEHIMLDLETMGNGPNAAIVAIGAVFFDPGCAELGPEFYEVVDLESSVKHGGVMDASTVMWWMKQGDEARAALGREAHHIQTTLGNFYTFLLTYLDDTNNLKVWGNGAAFDNVILRTTCERAGYEVPWNFWNDRCYRTMKAMLDPKGDMLVRSGTHHNALDDAKTQAMHLSRMLQFHLPGA